MFYKKLLIGVCVMLVGFGVYTLFGAKIEMEGDAVRAEKLVDLIETDTTNTPPTGYGRVYVKSVDSKLYFKNDIGTQYNLTKGPGDAILTSVDIACNGNDMYSALLVGSVPSTGKVWLRSLENSTYINLDNLSFWGNWIDFGTPDASSQLTGISVTVVYNSSTDRYSALIVARMTSGKVWLRSCENTTYINLDNLSFWGSWTDFGNPGL